MYPTIGQECSTSVNDDASATLYVDVQRFKLKI